MGSILCSILNPSVFHLLVLAFIGLLIGLDLLGVQANEQTYEGEDQEMEGGWIEDAAEDGTQ